MPVIDNSERKILITGANGFVGSQIVKYLADKGYQIVALTYDKAGIDNLKEINKVQFKSLDITNLDALESLFCEYKFDVVIHLAALIRQGRLTQEQYLKVNYSASADIFKLSNSSDVKQFIFFSTTDLYDNKCSADIFTEDSKVRPVSSYAQSKYMVEQYLTNAGQGKAAYTILRPAAIYGPNDKNGNMAKIFKLVKKGVFPIIGDGCNRKSLLNIDNLAEFVDKIILSKSCFNQVFNVCDEESYSMLEIVGTMERVSGVKVVKIKINNKLFEFFIKLLRFLSIKLLKKEIINKNFTDKFVSNNVCSIEKIKKAVGYSPRYILEDGLTKYYA